MDFTDKMNVTALIAEQKIQEAIKEGQFDNLPGRGKPQKLEDLSSLPEEMRLAYTVLKNSGFLEGDAEDRMPGLKELMACCEGREVDSGRLERLKFLLSRSGACHKACKREAVEERIDAAGSGYIEKILDRVSPSPDRVDKSSKSR